MAFVINATQKPLNNISNSKLKQAVWPTKTCPTGFILVPGSRLYSTGDFCVMKYEAKCADVSNPNLGLAPMPGNVCSGLSVDGGYAGVYKNNGSSCACTASNKKQVVSTKSGFPIAFIPMSDNTNNNAKAYCQSK